MISNHSAFDRVRPDPLPAACAARRRARRLLAVLVGAGTALASFANAEILYSQPFDDPATLTNANGNAVETYGWAAHRGDTGQNSLRWDPGPLNASQGNQLRIVLDAGAPTAPNRIFSYSAPASKDFLVWTEAAGSVTLAGNGPMTISWVERVDSGGGGIRAVVRVHSSGSDAWYASSPAETGTTWDQKTANLRTSVWIPFSFDGTLTADASGSFDVSGATESLPDGALTAVGLYLELVSAKGARFDSFVLEGELPNPGTVFIVR